MIKKLILTVAILIAPLTAIAIPITITGQGSVNGVWEIDTFLCDRTDASCHDIKADQVWFGNFDLAHSFALALGSGLGLINQPDQSSKELGPLFAFENHDNSLGWAYNNWSNTPVVSHFSGGADTQYWAVAERANVPEPASAMLLLLGLAGLSVSRKLKQS
jgi:hypothetical protein